MCTAHIPYSGALELDHIDGDRENNTIENVQTLCKICHSYKGHKKGDFKKKQATSVSDLGYEKYIMQFGFLTKPAVAIDADIVMGEAKWVASIINGETAKQCHILSPQGPGVLSNRPDRSLSPSKQKELAFVETLEKIYPRDELPQIKGKNIDDEYSSERLDVPISKLRPSQDERIKKYVKKALRLLKQGKEKPIIIDKHGYIVNGHHRYDAYKKLNYKTIPAIKVNATIEQLIDKYM